MRTGSFSPARTMMNRCGSSPRRRRSFRDIPCRAWRQLQRGQSRPTRLKSADGVIISSALKDTQLGLREDQSGEGETVHGAVQETGLIHLPRPAMSGCAENVVFKEVPRRCSGCHAFARRHLKVMASNLGSSTGLSKNFRIPLRREE